MDFGSSDHMCSLDLMVCADYFYCSDDFVFLFVCTILFFFDKVCTIYLCIVRFMCLLNFALKSEKKNQKIKFCSLYKQGL
jgi:hypothetical protein